MSEIKHSAGTGPERNVALQRTLASAQRDANRESDRSVGSFRVEHLKGVTVLYLGGFFTERSLTDSVSEAMQCASCTEEMLVIDFTAAVLVATVDQLNRVFRGRNIKMVFMVAPELGFRTTDDGSPLTSIGKSSPPMLHIRSHEYAIKRALELAEVALIDRETSQRRELRGNR